MVSHGNIKAANKRFCKSNYDITVIPETTIEEYKDDQTIPDHQEAFIPLDALGHRRFLDTQNDVIGVITQVEPVTSILLKRDNTNRSKRTVTIADDTMHEVFLSHCLSQLSFAFLD